MGYGLKATGWLQEWLNLSSFWVSSYEYQELQGSVWLKVNCLFVVDHFLLSNIWYVKMGERFKLICGFSAFVDRLFCLGTCVFVRVLCKCVYLPLCIVCRWFYLHRSKTKKKNSERVTVRVHVSVIWQACSYLVKWLTHPWLIFKYSFWESSCSKFYWKLTAISNELH